MRGRCEGEKISFAWRATPCRQGSPRSTREHDLVREQWSATIVGWLLHTAALTNTQTSRCRPGALASASASVRSTPRAAAVARLPNGRQTSTVVDAWTTPVAGSRFGPVSEPGSRQGRRAFWLTIAALAWSAALVGGAFVLPFYGSSGASSTGAYWSGSLSLVDVNGLGVLVPVGIPVMISALVSQLLSRRTNRRVPRLDAGGGPCARLRGSGRINRRPDPPCGLAAGERGRDHTLGPGGSPNRLDKPRDSARGLAADLWCSQPTALCPGQMQ